MDGFARCVSLGSGKEFGQQHKHGALLGPELDIFSPFCLHELPCCHLGRSFRGVLVTTDSCLFSEGLTVGESSTANETVDQSIGPFDRWKKFGALEGDRAGRSRRERWCLPSSTD